MTKAPPTIDDYLEEYRTAVDDIERSRVIVRIGMDHPTSWRALTFLMRLVEVACQDKLPYHQVWGLATAIPFCIQTFPDEATLIAEKLAKHSEEIDAVYRLAVSLVPAL